MRAKARETGPSPLPTFDTFQTAGRATTVDTEITHRRRLPQVNPARTHSGRRVSASPGVAMARLRVCADPGCPELSAGRHCPAHATQHERARGTRQARGYDAAYDRARRRWAPRVAACTVHCHATVCIEPSGRLILPHQPWDLGHDDQRHIRGPEHARCNRSAGGKAAHL